MKPFATISVCLNLATILIYGTIVRAQFDGLEVNATISLKSVEKAECERSDCTLAVHSTGSGSKLDDGCTKTGEICTGTCARCQGARPAQATGYCKKQDTTKTCYVEEALSDTTQGKFSCGKSHKYQCKKNNDGPSTCCSKDQDGSQPIEGPKCDDAYACNPDQQSTPGSGDGGANGGSGDGDGNTGDPGDGDGSMGNAGSGDEGAGDTDPQMPTEP